MNQDTEDFIETWKKRISSIKSVGLNSLFDNFTALYILYNRLYNESFKELKSSNKLTKARYSDFDKATSLVVEFNNAKNVIQSLKKNNII